MAGYHPWSQREQPLQRLLHFIRHLVDDAVGANVDALLLGKLYAPLGWRNMKSYDNGIARAREKSHRIR